MGKGQDSMDRANFHKRFMEAMLSGKLIDEVDLTKFSEVSNQESGMTDFEIQDDVDTGLREWSAEYDALINAPPKEGDILTASTLDANVLLMVELKEDSPPFIYGRAYVPEIVGHPLGWFLLDTDSQSYHGWKCILLPRARTELIRKFGLQNESMEVRSLRVIRVSQSGKSLLCEVHEYCKVEKAEEKVKMEVADPGEVPREPKVRPSGHVERRNPVEPAVKVQDQDQDQETEDSLTADTERATSEPEVKAQEPEVTIPAN